jgi:hypothetical protein
MAAVLSEQVTERVNRRFSGGNCPEMRFDIMPQGGKRA